MCVCVCVCGVCCGSVFTVQFVWSFVCLYEVSSTWIVCVVSGVCVKYMHYGVCVVNAVCLCQLYKLWSVCLVRGCACVRCVPCRMCVN